MMTSLFVGPGRLRGSVAAPPSKSIAHRVLIGAALAKMNGSALDSVLGLGSQLPDDLAATISCLHGLFAQSIETIRLNCGESASTLRFLVPIAAALGKTAEFGGDTALSKRPLRDYGRILSGKGVNLQFLSEDSLPLRISGQLQPGHYTVPGSVSSQYVTGLLLALPLLAAESKISLTSPLQSAPYVEITESVLKKFGIGVEPFAGGDWGCGGWLVPGQQAYQLPREKINVEGDYSQSAFWLVAAHLGHDVEVTGLNLASLQGDQAIASLLSHLETKRGEDLRIDVSQIPDLVPPLAVAALFRPGRTVFVEAARLRLKESDRLHVLANELAGLGAQVEEGPAELIVTGGKTLVGGGANAHNDHRIAMALAIAACQTERGVIIEGASSVRKSYPNFFMELRRLGGVVSGFELG